MVPFILLISLVISIVVLSSAPSVSKDAFTHHLAIRKFHLNHRAIYEVPFAGFSYYLMNLDVLYLDHLYFGNWLLIR